MTMIQGCHAYDRGVELKDATLMLLSESGGHPAVASLAKSAARTGGGRFVQDDGARCW
jgi:hypothetical protein